MSSFAIFGATVFGGTICFLMGFISGRIWQRHIDRPVTNMAYGNRSSAQMQARIYEEEQLRSASEMGQRGIPNAPAYPVDGQRSMSGTFQGPPYAQGQAYRMGDWDKGRQE